MKPQPSNHIPRANPLARHAFAPPRATEKHPFNQRATFPIEGRKLEQGLALFIVWRDGKALPRSFHDDAREARDAAMADAVRWPGETMLVLRADLFGTSAIAAPVATFTLAESAMELASEPFDVAICQTVEA